MLTVFNPDRGHENVVKWLVQQGANVDAYSTNLCECAYPPLSHHFSWTPLHLAICNSQENTVRLLLANNASLKTSEEFNIEALHTAAAEGSASTILHLSTHPGFDVDVKDHTGRTPLHHAIMASRGPDTVKALLNFGADVQGGCDDSLRPPYTPLWSALAQGDLEVAVMLLENGAKPFVNKDKDSKRVAPYRQQLRRRQRLHQVSLLGVTLRKKNTTENSRRHGVLQRKVIRALLDFGCDIDQDLSRFGSMELTPLTLAASHSSSATVRLLLDRGAKVNAKAGFRSALCHALSESAPASLSESVDKVTALLEHGADLLDPSVIWHLNIRHSSRTMLDTVADNLSPENLNDSLRIPRALGICCIFQERKMYNSIKIHARVQLQATDKDIQYVLEQSACSKRACVPACLDELGPILDEMRPGLTVDGALDQWRDVMSDAAVKWLKEIKGRESSG